MRMAALKRRAPPHMTKRVKMITPMRPAQGCQAGMVTGVDILSVMTMGVKGGINDNQVEKLERGSFTTGMSVNMGIIMGSIAGKESDWASFASFATDPNAAMSEPSMKMRKIELVKNQGKTS